MMGAYPGAYTTTAASFVEGVLTSLLAATVLLLRPAAAAAAVEAGLLPVAYGYGVPTASTQVATV